MSKSQNVTWNIDNLGNDQELIQSNSMSCQINQRNTYKKDGIKYKLAQAQSQEDSFVPADVHQATLKKAYKKSRTNRKRTNIEN